MGLCHPVVVAHNDSLSKSIVVLQCVAVCCSVVQCGAVWCSVVQCVAGCCRVVQCGAVCCSVDRSKFIMVQSSQPVQIFEFEFGARATQNIYHGTEFTTRSNVVLGGPGTEFKYCCCGWPGHREGLQQKGP